jgi:hypothetical protein
MSSSHNTFMGLVKFEFGDQTGVTLLSNIRAQVQNSESKYVMLQETNQ